MNKIKVLLLLIVLCISLVGCGEKTTIKPDELPNNSTESTPVKLDIVIEDVAKIELPWSPVNEQKAFSAVLKSFASEEIILEKREWNVYTPPLYRDSHILHLVDDNYSLTRKSEFYKEEKKSPENRNEYIKSVGGISDCSENFIGVFQDHSLWILTSSKLDKKDLYLYAKDLQTEKAYKLTIANVDGATDKLLPIGGAVSDSIIWIAFTSIKPNDRTNVVAAWTFTPGDGFQEIISKDISDKSTINKGNNIIIITKDEEQEDAALIMFTEATRENSQLLEWKHHVRVLRCKLAGYSTNK